MHACFESTALTSPLLIDDSSMLGSDGDSASDAEALAGATFTDENRAWLKPKAKGQQLLSSDDEGKEEEDDNEEEASEEGDDDEMLQLQMGDSDVEEEEDEEEEGEFEEEEDEFDEEGGEGDEYMEGGEGEGEGEEKDDKGRRLGLPEEIKGRIEEVVEILSDFRQRRKPGGALSVHTSIHFTVLTFTRTHHTRLAQCRGRSTCGGWRGTWGSTTATFLSSPICSSPCSAPPVGERACVPACL